MIRGPSLPLIMNSMVLSSDPADRVCIEAGLNDLQETFPFVERRVLPPEPRPADFGAPRGELAAASPPTPLSRTELALRRLLHSSEQRQSSIGHQLHEGLSQELAGLSLLASALAARLAQGQHPEVAAAVEIAEGLSRAICSARDIAKDCYPVDLVSGGLITALEQAAHLTTIHTGAACVLSHEGPSPEIDFEDQIQFYRIIQEEIAHAVKERGASRIRIETRTGTDAFDVTVTDNGRTPIQGSASSAMGGFEEPLLLSYRARLVGARLRLRKSWEGGRRMTCKLSRKSSVNRSNTEVKKAGDSLSGNIASPSGGRQVAQPCIAA
jgi:signal transduction histidine kinase